MNLKDVNAKSLRLHDAFREVVAAAHELSVYADRSNGTGYDAIVTWKSIAALDEALNEWREAADDYPEGK
jgi:hypothetical protein